MSETSTVSYGSAIPAALPSPPEEPPAQWIDEFTMHGRFPMVNDYINMSVEAQAGSIFNWGVFQGGVVTGMNPCHYPKLISCNSGVHPYQP